MANEYVVGRAELAALDDFIYSHVDESVALDETGRPEALLFGFIQVRIYEMQAGDVSEEDLRRDVVGYLREYGLLRGAGRTD